MLRMLHHPPILALHAPWQGTSIWPLAAGMPRRRSASLGAHGEIHIALGESITDRGSIFTAQLAWPLKSEAAAIAAIAKMRQQDACAGADHNMTAYRVTERRGVSKAYDDDGEAHGGQRLLGALTRAKATNVAVMVSRVYGGQNIGKARFEHIVERAMSLLAEVGHVPGVGIQHSWGEGQALGGSPAPSASQGGAPQRKRPREDAATQAAEAAARRAAMAEAAERRLAGLQQQRHEPTVVD